MLFNKPLTEHDEIWRDWAVVACLWLFALGCLGGNALDFQRFKYVRLALSGMSAISAGLGVAKVRQIERRSPYYSQREVMRNDLFIETQAQQIPSLQPKSQRQPALMPANGGDRPYPFDVQSFLNEVTGVAILGNSGAGKTQLAKYLANAVGASQILVLDPHADIEDEHYPWDELTVISDKDQILKQLHLLLKLLDKKDRTPLIIIADEYPAIRSYANKVGSDVADEFILRYGSEARKFKKLPIFISQSGNVKSLGLDGQGDFLENFALIRLQKIARKYLKNSPDRELYELVKAIAYPMLIGDEELVIHPTHGGYAQAQKNLPPQNLKPLVSLPLTIPLVDGTNQPLNLQKLPPTIATENNSLDYYERCFSLEFDLDSATSDAVTPNQQQNHLQPPQDKAQAEQPVSQKIDPFAPITGETQQLVRRLLSEGWSQNRLVFELFKVGSKGSRAYYQAVNIIKGIQSI